MPIDIDSLKFWLDVIWKAGTVLGLVWLALRQQSRDNQKRIDRHDERLDDHAMELVVIREQLKGHPTHTDLEKLHDRISNLRDELGKTREGLAQVLEAMIGLRKAVDRLHDHHMGLGKGTGQ